MNIKDARAVARRDLRETARRLGLGVTESADGYVLYRLDDGRPMHWAPSLDEIDNILRTLVTPW